MRNKYNELALLAATVVAAAPAFAQQGPVARTAQAMTGSPAASASVVQAPSRPLLRPCESVTVDPVTHLTLGKSRVVRLPFPAARMVVGGHPGSEAGRPRPVTDAADRGNPRQSQGGGKDWDGVAETDITLLSPTEMYFLGRRAGAMNVVVQGTDGRCLVKDIVVTVDPSAIEGTLRELMPEESGIRVRSAENNLVLTGTVSDALKLDQVLHIVGSYGGDAKKIVNLLRTTAPQQVMLEVKIAEVSKSVLDNLNLDFARAMVTGGGTTAKFFQGLLGGGPLFATRVNGMTDGQLLPLVTQNFGNSTVTGPARVVGDKLMPISATSATSGALTAQHRDGVLRVLAEPTIMAVSGQSASFLSGGKIFIPVAQNRGGNGGSTITLEEKEFGVGLKFTPTVLDGSRINLKLVSEASELSQTGSPFTSFNGETAILPSMATRRVDTTVQLNDGQSFVVAGLIKNNMNEALTKFPGLGEVPVMGALFRSTEFQNDQTELMFVVTPRLVKPLGTPIVLPTDNHIVPGRNEVMFMGAGEGKRDPAIPAQVMPAQVVPAEPAAVVTPPVESAPLQPAGPAPTPSTR